MKPISLAVLLLAGCGGGPSAGVRADATPPPAPRPEGVGPPHAAPTPAPPESAEPPADAVCRVAWRMPIEPAADGPTTLAGLEGWAVLVTGTTRFNLVSNRAAPERIELPTSPLRAYAARGRDRGGVLLGAAGDTFALRLDQRDASAPLPLSPPQPASAHSDGELATVAAPSREGIVVLVFLAGAAPRRVVVPGPSGENVQVHVRGTSIGLAWRHDRVLELALVDAVTGTVTSRASLPVPGTNRIGVTSLAPAGEAWVVAYGETHVHTGGRAYWVRLVRWVPGSAPTLTGLPDDVNRSEATLAPLGARTLAAWVEGPLLAPGALEVATLDAALAVQGEPLVLSTQGADAEAPQLSVSGTWAWLTWLEGQRRMAAGLRCTRLAEPVESGLGAPAGCDGPEDCGGRRCVTSSLGGMYGCTDETCCGAAECGNGCRTDADCPSCRPTCRRAEGHENGGCVR